MHHDYVAVAAINVSQETSVSDIRNDALHRPDTETIVTSMTHAEYVLPVSNTGILG